MIFNIETYKMKTLFEKNVMILHDKIHRHKHNNCTYIGVFMVLGIMSLLFYKYKTKQNKFKTNVCYLY